MTTFSIFKPKSNFFTLINNKIKVVDIVSIIAHATKFCRNNFYISINFLSCFVIFFFVTLFNINSDIFGIAKRFLNLIELDGRIVYVVKHNDRIRHSDRKPSNCNLASNSKKACKQNHSTIKQRSKKQKIELINIGFCYTFLFVFKMNMIFFTQLFKRMIFVCICFYFQNIASC